MDNTELVQLLYAPFQLHEHEIREGPAKNKQQWFVYVRREAITKRLDLLFPLAWTTETISCQPNPNGFTVTLRLMIDGIGREYNGDGKDEKSAFTDAFKRVASMWGIGLYLQSTPPIWTNGGFKTQIGTDWKERNKQKDEALSKFATWHKQLVGNTAHSPQDTHQDEPQGGKNERSGDESINTSETQIREVGVTKIQAVKDSGKRNYICHTDATDPAVFKAYTRQLFIEAGWLDENELTEFGAVFDFDPPIPVTLKLNERGYWTLMSVASLDIEQAAADYLGVELEPDPTGINADENQIDGLSTFAGDEDLGDLA